MYALNFYPASVYNKDKTYIDDQAPRVFHCVCKIYLVLVRKRLYLMTMIFIIIEARQCNKDTIELLSSLKI